MNASQARHFDTLDGVRGLAASIVLISHSAIMGLLPVFLGDRFGQQAVLLFFTLSGFLMFHLYGERPFTQPEIARYACHRVGRVVPLFYLVVLLSVLILYFALPVWVFPINTIRTFCEHLFFIRGVSSLWTVPVEIQFYVVFLVLWFAFGKKRFFLAVASIEILALILALAEKMGMLEPGLLASTVQYFLVGACLAYIRNHTDLLGRVTAPRYRKWLLLTIVFFTILSSSIVRRALMLHMAPTWWDPILGGLPVLIFIAALQSVKPFHLLATPLLRWLGTISYGIYIFHFPVLATLVAALPPHSWWQGLLLFGTVWAVTLGVAYLSFVFFESPLRKAISINARKGRGRPYLMAESQTP
jgi:peptidoglycan/LPS O-acetylase OafA/YrhL